MKLDFSQAAQLQMSGLPYRRAGRHQRCRGVVVYTCKPGVHNFFLCAKCSRIIRSEEVNHQTPHGPIVMPDEGVDNSMSGPMGERVQAKFNKDGSVEVSVLRQDGKGWKEAFKALVQ